jgi:hypothetical protein
LNGEAEQPGDAIKKMSSPSPVETLPLHMRCAAA